MSNATIEPGYVIEQDENNDAIGGLFLYQNGQLPEDADSIFDEPEAPVDDEPEVIDGGVVQLRGYQQKAVDNVLQEFRNKISATTVVMATGTGKSVCLAELAKWANERDHGVLILVHRNELINQLRASCGRCGVPTGKEKAESQALYGYPNYWKTVIASVQTMRGDRLQQWPRDSFKLIIVDEAHHALRNNSYGKIMEHFGVFDGRCRAVGFTATPDRLDKQNIGQIFETCAFEYNTRDATRDGWLTPFEVIQLKPDPPIDLSELRLVGDDFNQGDLERVVQDNIGVLVNSLVQTNALENRRTIGFSPNVNSAIAIADALSDVGISARATWGSDPKRQETFAAHKAGKFQVLMNCMLATEGYDDPEVAAALLCRPTQSRALYNQMVGRANRLLGGKRTARIVDFTYITGKHKLVSPIELYDNSEVPDEVIEKARDLIEDGSHSDLDEAIEEAQEIFENERRVRIQKRVVNVQAVKFDPLTICDVLEIPHKATNNWMDTKPATEKQINALKKWGIEVGEEGVGKGTASRILQKVLSRQEHGWARPSQVKKLIESGIDVKTATGMRAHEAEKYLSENPLPASEKQKRMLRWKKVPEHEISLMTRQEASQRISVIMNAEKQSKGNTN